MGILDFVVNHSSALLALLTTGACAGLLAGLLGVGGGIIIVPVLFFLFQSNDVSPASAMVIATATSLATIVPTSISSIRAHYKKGNVDCPLLVRWGPFHFCWVCCWAVGWSLGLTAPGSLPCSASSQRCLRSAAYVDLTRHYSKICPTGWGRQ